MRSESVPRPTYDTRKEDAHTRDKFQLGHIYRHNNGGEYLIVTNSAEHGLVFWLVSDSHYSGDDECFAIDAKELTDSYLTGTWSQQWTEVEREPSR